MRTTALNWKVMDSWVILHGRCTGGIGGTPVHRYIGGTQAHWEAIDAALGTTGLDRNYWLGLYAPVLSASDLGLGWYEFSTERFIDSMQVLCGHGWKLCARSVARPAWYVPSGIVVEHPTG